jgi:transcriptional regulator with XRE-family HTH domain
MAGTPAATPTVYIEAGRRIQDARKKAGITQERLADAVGLSRASMSNIERGRHKILLHVLEDIARALAVDLHDLLPPRRPGASKLESQVPSDVSPILKEFILKMEKRLAKDTKQAAAVS